MIDPHPKLTASRTAFTLPQAGCEASRRTSASPAPALIPRNAASVRAPRPEKPEIHPLSPGQARKLIATARETDDRFEALYVLALHCGLREGELLGLKWDDIDQSGTSATLQVKRTLSQIRTGPTFEKPKNGKGRSVKCSQKATEALRSHRTRQNQGRLAAGPLWQDNNLAFPIISGTTSRHQPPRPPLQAPPQKGRAASYQVP